MTITKRQIQQHFQRKSTEINNTLQSKIYFCAGIEAREQIGVIHFLWLQDFISTEERNDLNEIFYSYIHKAEKGNEKPHYTF